MNTYEKVFDEVVGLPKCELNYENNFQLLIAVVLSAQCTDKRVNMVTKNLFTKLGRFVTDFVKSSSLSYLKLYISVP